MTKIDRKPVEKPLQNVTGNWDINVNLSPVLLTSEAAAGLALQAVESRSSGQLFGRVGGLYEWEERFSNCPCGG